MKTSRPLINAITATFVLCGARDRLQPRFTMYGPDFICRDKLIFDIKRPQVHFSFVIALSENR